jgi:hypothetical protein
MKNPSEHRLHGYQAGWLTLLLQMRVADEKELQDAQNTVAQAAIDKMNERQARSRSAARKKRRRD